MVYLHRTRYKSHLIKFDEQRMVNSYDSSTINNLIAQNEQNISRAKLKKTVRTTSQASRSITTNYKYKADETPKVVVVYPTIQ